MLRDEAAKNECCLFGAQDGTSEGEGEDEWKVKQQRSVTEKESLVGESGHGLGHRLFFRSEDSLRLTGRNRY
jgi:hypothetical protein